MKFTAFTTIKNRFVLFNASWRKLSENKIVRFATYGSFAVSVCTLLLPILWWTKLPPVVPLWFSRPWGTDRLASPFALYVLPIGSVIWTYINMYVSSTLLSDNLVFSQIVAITSFVASMLVAAEVLEIILIVI